MRFVAWLNYTRLGTLLQIFKEPNGGQSININQYLHTQLMHNFIKGNGIHKEKFLLVMFVHINLEFLTIMYVLVILRLNQSQQ